MKRTREQMKAEIMKRFETELDQLLEWQAKAHQPDLTQFENEILAARKAMSEFAPVLWTQNKGEFFKIDGAVIAQSRV